MNKKGFGIIELLIIVVGLSVSLITMFSTYTKASNTQKNNVCRDDIDYVFRLNHLKNYLLDNVDANLFLSENIKEKNSNASYLDDTLSVQVDYSSFYSEPYLDQILKVLRVDKLIFLKPDFNKIVKCSDKVLDGNKGSLTNSEYYTCLNTFDGLDSDTIKYIRSLGSVDFDSNNYILVASYLNEDIYNPEEGKDEGIGFVDICPTKKGFAWIDSEISHIGKPFSETILENNGGIASIEAKGIPNFVVAATTNEGMYAFPDDYGTSYYFRGAVDNNWVYFAGFYWRIVRINGNGSVKLIYSGKTAPLESEKVMMEEDETLFMNCAESCKNPVPEGSISYEGEEVQSCIESCYPFKTLIGVGLYNPSEYGTGEYIGYMYTMGEHRGYATNSDIKTVIDTWFGNNLKTYEKQLKDFIVCNDRGFENDWVPIGLSPGWKGSNVNARFRFNNTPQLICPNKEDAFTVGDIEKGNGKLTYPVGLLTAEEAYIAGLGQYGGSPNYLLINHRYWLSSPSSINYFYYMFSISASNFINGTQDFVISLYGIRPVISLSSKLSVKGTGQWNDPYEVI